MNAILRHKQALLDISTDLQSHNSCINVIFGYSNTRQYNDKMEASMSISVLSLPEVIQSNSTQVNMIHADFHHHNHHHHTSFMNCDLNTCCTIIRLSDITSNIAMTVTTNLQNATFWDLAPCGSCQNHSFEGMCCFHLQGRKNP
jgi:hypothetical protein